MKIAVFNRHFSRQAGGAESYSVALVEGLANDHDVHVFAQTIEHSHPRVTYHKVPGPLHRPRWINQLVFATYTWWKTRKSSKDGGFDVIHSHENTWHGQVQTVHVRPIRFHLFEGLVGWRVPLRWLKIVTSPRLAFYVWLEAARMKPKQNRSVIAVSSLLREQTLAAYPHLPKNLPVILPGVGEPNRTLSKTEAREKLGVGAMGDGPLVLFVGNDYARKGLPALLAAMPALEAHVHLLCVGKPGLVPQFQLKAAELGVAKRVHFAGALADMSVAYQAADLLVHPTLEDSFAMVVLEAMSYGLPVVASSSQYCGISQFLQGGVDALLLDEPKDSTAISTAITQILSNEALRQSLSDRGLRFAAKHQWSEALSQYLAIYAAVKSVA